MDIEGLQELRGDTGKTGSVGEWVDIQGTLNVKNDRGDWIVQGALGAVATLAFSPDGSMLACGGESLADIPLLRHDAQVEEEPLTISTTAPGRLKLWDVQTGKILHDLAGHSNQVSAAAFSPDGKWLASAGHWLDAKEAGQGVKPIEGAKVRYFCKTGEMASGFPFPVGIQGPVWAVSQADGTVLLDSLQKFDPIYDKVGDSLYYFYIESPNAAGHFLGGIKAGVEVGDIRIGPLLEVRGEIHGTPEELRNFAAEWDQPFQMTTANPEANFAYAVSRNLEVKRDGDKLSFCLTGLRAGKLRLICDFSPHPHSVKHNSEKREPDAKDVVIELDLSKSLSGLVIAPRGVQQIDAVPKGDKENGGRIEK